MQKFLILTCLLLVSFLVLVSPVDAASNFTTSDGVIYDDGQPITIKGVNWFGFETENKAVHGLWARNWKEMIGQIKSTGFNAIRVPFCPATLDNVNVSGVDYGLNPDLQNLKSLEIMDKVLAELDAQGIYFLLDSHRPNCSGQSDLWYTSSYSEQAWQDDLVFLANRYQNNDHFLGIDLKNEPHGATWGTGNIANDWKIAAENAGQKVLAENDNLLIFIEGITSNPSCSTNSNAFWSENLEPQNCYPISTAKIPANKQIFSPHVYGPDVYVQPYMNDSNFPNNLAGIWDTHFGFLRDDNYTIVIGEWGGKYGHGGYSKDKAWQQAFADYMVSKDICHSFYWSWNPNSGDTGGVLQDDWTNVWQDKVDLLQNLYSSCSVDASPQPSPSPTIEPSPSPSSSPASCSADINLDGKVDIIDYNILATNFFSSNPSNPRADINQSGLVDLSDYSILVSKFFQNCGS